MPDTDGTSWLQWTSWQDMAEPISQASGASGKTHLRRGRMPQREEEGTKIVRKGRGNTKVTGGGGAPGTIADIPCSSQRELFLERRESMRRKEQQRETAVY